MGVDNNDDKDGEDGVKLRNGSLKQHHIDMELTTIEDENQKLILQLQQLRARRRTLAKLSQDTVNRMCHCQSVESKAVLDRQEAVQEYQSVRSRKRHAEKWLTVAQRWNVTDDCFSIWYDGDFGTINQLRLGSESRVSTGVAMSQDVNGSKTPFVNGTSTTTSWYSGISTTTQPAIDPTKPQAPLSSSLAATAATTTTTPLPLTTIIKVPWNEINSALGLVALLLSSLETRPQSNIKFQHEIIPMGNTSKIGIRAASSTNTTTTTTPTPASALYPLYSDDRFHFFGKRNFNVALNALSQCLAEAADEIQKRDRTMSLPHDVTFSKTSGEWSIGGLPVSYGVDGEQWTRAMKYFLTDLKWCVAYLARHVDR